MIRSLRTVSSDPSQQHIRFTKLSYKRGNQTTYKKIPLCKNKPQVDRKLKYIYYMQEYKLTC